MKRSAITLVAILAFALAGGCYAQSGQAQRSIDALQQPLPQKPDPDASAAELEAQGDALRRQKAYEEAGPFYEAAIAKNSRRAALFNKMGIVELQLNHTRPARKRFERAIKLDPRYAEAHNNLGVAFYLDRDYKRAIRHYERALKLDETSASFHSNLGTAWFARKKTDKAMAEYARAIELDPDVLLRSATGGMSAQVLSPEDRGYHSYLLAKMYAKSGDVDRCLECLRKAKEAGFKRLGDAYKDADFILVRSDARFAELFARPPRE